MKLKVLCLSTLLVSPLLGFEINTHQAITRCALSNLCGTNGEGKGGAENLNFFVYSMLLDSESYESEVFEGSGYGNQSYIEYSKKGEGLGEANLNEENEGKYIDFKSGDTCLKGAINSKGELTNRIDFQANSYISLIEAGSILEDALYPKVTTIPKIRDADGRFNNHFYSAQFYWCAA